MVVIAFILSCILLTADAKSNIGVVELGERDFDEQLKGRNAMVMFYSPSCGHCMRFKPVFENLASLKSITSLGTVMAKVDCTQGGRKVCEKYGITGYPTLKFISRVGKTETVEDYRGNRELGHVEKFIVINSRDPIVEVSDSAIATFVESTTLPVVVGFFKDDKSKLYNKLLSLAHQHKKDFTFGYTFSKDAAKNMEQSVESIVLYWQQQYKTPMDDVKPVCLVEKELGPFLQKNRFSIVEYRNPENDEEFKMPSITAFLPIDPLMKRSTAKRLRNVMIKQAREHSSITFSISKQSDYEMFLKDIAPQAKPNDIQLIAFSEDGKKFLCPETVNVEDHKKFGEILAKFIADFEKGDVLEEFIKSEPIPTQDDGHVKVVVAKTFNSIVVDNDHDVLIEFYAPWCGHCKKLTPIYQQLATLLKDEPKLVIGKYDATANDQQKNFPVEGFPTIYLAKAGKKSSPIQYSGKRDAASMLEWLKRETTHGIKFEGEAPELKEEL